MRTEELLELRRREAAELAEADRIVRQLGIEQDPDPPALEDFLVSQGRELERLRAKVRLPGDPERDPALAPLEARFGLLRTPEEDVSEDSGSELPDEGSGSGGAG
jgi:hypothetical protein